MNFKRIEWVFVIAFLGLNIFLFFLYQEGAKEISNFSSSSKTEAIETLLRKDQIAFSGDFSEEKREGYYLSGELSDLTQELAKKRSETNTGYFSNRTTTISDSTLTHQMDEKQLISVEDVQAGIRAFLSKDEFVLLGSEYSYLDKFSSFSDEESVIVAGQLFEGIPFNDDTSRIQISLAKSGDMYRIEKYTQTHISNIEKLREKMELYSEKEAIASLYTNSRIPANSTIKWIQLAYSRTMQVRDKSVYIPVWFVGIQSGEGSIQVESVNALNNTVITGNPVSKVASE